MNSDHGDPLFKIDPAAIGNPLLRTAARISRPLVERTLCFPALNRIYAATQGMDESLSFPRRVLKAMNVTWTVGEPAVPPPKEGPVVIVSNHPFGGIEGVLLVALLEAYRDDAKVMVNYLLNAIPDLRRHFFFVDPFGGPDAKRANLKSMKASLKWLEEGHVLAAFPAGEVSSIDLRAGFVRDNVWSPTIARMARKTGATVVPVFFEGGNGAFFNLAGLVHPRLRTLLLPRQFVNKANRELRVEVGQPITPREMEPFDTDEKLTAFLRMRTYVLGERPSAKPPRRDGASPAAAKPRQAPVVDPVPPEELAAEIAALPPEAFLCDGEGLSVYCATAAQIPRALREIGRLREVTYREIGEGTNNEIDLDAYDDYYRHLFIWNASTREIVGAYRLGLADEIVPRFGVKGLYTHTCFRFGDDLVSRLQPAIELGRSFVRREYQRAFSSLMLLWKGISVFVARNPRYKTFFGPVSISNDYLEASRGMMIRSLRATNFANGLSRFVRSRVAPRRLGRSEWQLPEYAPLVGDLEIVSRMVQEIEPDQKGIPVLLRQYVKLGGKVLCFNVDPAFNFCVDGLIAVHIPNADARVLKRYMGPDDYAAYQAAHAGEEAPL